ncbi:hypothetical protein AB0K47_11715 [Streptomyces tirandamycinicus]|uniref:hypothetical protein n=1 Tax=Streptomyces tirandamycinicus TaxID=2174846 RepID=UPI00342E2173
MLLACNDRTCRGSRSCRGKKHFSGEEAYRVYPDFGPAREALRAQGITTGTDLATALLDRHGIATLPGSAFGEPGTALTLRLATSLLYGTTPQQRHTALTARDPETLPWISPALRRLSAALTELTAGRHRRPRS